MIEIYTDGACIGNPGPGGWGVVILNGSQNLFLSGGDSSTTNNRMEITAVIEALKNVDDNDVTIYSDSTYVINTITKGWKKNKNQDLWELLEKLLFKKNVTWKWVKGHSGNEFNEKADQLAYGEAKKKMKINEPDSLTHVDHEGTANMVDVSQKPVTFREAIAKSLVTMNPETLQKIIKNEFEKGDVLSVARVAGVMAGKQTSNLIPLCHPLQISHLNIDFELDNENSQILIIATAKINSQTGVEMEALTAASVSALTIYDMCKAVDKTMKIQTWLSYKSGGKSGDHQLD